MDHVGNLNAVIYMKLKYTRGSCVFHYWHIPCKDQTDGIPNCISQSWEVCIILRESEVLLVGRERFKAGGHLLLSGEVTVIGVQTCFSLSSGIHVRCGLRVHSNHIQALVCLALQSHPCFLRGVIGTGMFRERADPMMFSSSWFP